jgi:hypothetical protein
MSGTTPSRWNAYQSPVRHSPVCASSRISSAALVALVAQRGQVAGRQVDHAAGAEDRLDDAGGEAAHRLRVDQVERVVELPRQSSSPSAW